MMAALAGFGGGSIARGGTGLGALAAFTGPGFRFSGDVQYER